LCKANCKGQNPHYTAHAWRRGRVAQARACKALYTGSIPVAASNKKPHLSWSFVQILRWGFFASGTELALPDPCALRSRVSTLTLISKSEVTRCEGHR
jgi:hypothetical protein